MSAALSDCRYLNQPDQVHALIERAYICHDSSDSCSMESGLAQRREGLDDQRVKSGLGNERNLGPRSGAAAPACPSKT
jgi:hypothetical protein